MSIAMNLLVCDYSIEMIAPMVLYHQPKVDFFVCAAHRPSRTLWAYLIELSERIPNFKLLGAVMEEYGPERQAEWSSWMIETSKSLGATWMINADDDEFYVGDVRGVVRDSERRGYTQICPDGHCFWEVEGEPYDPNPVRRMIWRDPDDTKYLFQKPIHQADGFLGTTPGNHFVRYDKGKRTIFNYTGDLKVFHYTYRRKALARGRDPLPTEKAREQRLVCDTRLVEEFDRINLPV